jgi:hypothetical protein
MKNLLQNLLQYLQNKWDWFIYYRSFHSLKRLAKKDVGHSYLLELMLHDWNHEEFENNVLSDKLKDATEMFHNAMKKYDDED